MRVHRTVGRKQAGGWPLAGHYPLPIGGFHVLNAKKENDGQEFGRAWWEWAHIAGRGDARGQGSRCQGQDNVFELSMKECDKVRAPENIAAPMAPPGRKCPADARWGRLQSARQLWRLINMLVKVRNGALTQKDVRNEDCFSEFIENKGAKKVLLRVCREYNRGHIIVDISC
jgi:hypothetical protein